MRYLAIAAVLVSCGPPAPPPPPKPVSYLMDLLPIFTTRCVACHYPGSPTHLDMRAPHDPVEGLVNRPNSYTSARHTVLVVPGKPEESALMDKIAATDLEPATEGSPMPPVVDAVTAAELASIRRWIVDGAQDDAFYRANVVPVFGTAANLGRAIGKCSYCHTATSPFSPNVVDPFSARGLVNVNSGFGGKRVVPGDPDASVLMKKLTTPLPANVGEAMPLNYPRLTADEVELVRRWIAEGANDN